MDIEQKQFFKEISDLFKSNLLIKAIRLINKKITTITDNNEFKYKLILILGKLCLKGRNVDTIIPMIENELKTNEIKGSIKFNLMALLYRCYYLKSSSGPKSETYNYQYKSKTTTSHCYSTKVINQSDNISDMVLVRNRSVSVQFINESLDERESKRIKFTDDDDNNNDDDETFKEDNSTYNYYDDLNFQYYLFCSDLNGSDRIAFKTPIKSISCGRYFSSILDTNGMVWNWGYNFEICSNGQSSPGYPYSINKQIKEITSGHHHCIALATDGTVYSWGINNFGTLGLLTSKSSNISTPTQIEFNNYNNDLDENDQILKISAGGFNSAFITKTGKLLVCGKNDRFQLGIEETTNLPPLFSIITDKKYIPSILVASSSIARDYSYLINNKQFSDLYITFGNNNGGKDNEIVYCHLILLTILENEILLNQLVELKLKSNDNIVRIDIIEFLNLVISSSLKKDDQSNKKLILEGLIAENQLFSDSFIDFISFIYTNTTSKRNMKTLFEYSKLFDCKQLTNYLNETSFNVIQEESDLSIPTKLLKRYNSDYLSDCTIISNDGKIKIKAHKSILISRLNYFKNLLVSNLENNNNNNNNNNNEIILNDEIPNNQLIPIIAYLYCDRIKFDLLSPEIINGDYVLSLCSTCDQLKLTRFKDGLLKLISNSVTKENAISLLLWSVKSDSTALYKFIKCFISLHHDFINSEHYDSSYLPFPFKQTSTIGQHNPIHVAKDERFVDVAVGAKLMVALTVDNKLYQLGIGSDRKRKPIQQLTLPYPDENTKIKKISCGSSHWIAMTENNKIYGMGCGDLNQLVDGSRKFCSDPTLISDSNKYNNAKAGFYASMYWNDLSNFPLHPNGLNNNNNNNNNNNSLKIDKPVTIEVYNDSSSSSSSLWFFKNYDFIDSLLDNKLSGGDVQNQQQENSNGEFSKSIISTTSSCLPPYLFELISNKDNGNDNTIQLFGFSKELIEKSFSTTTKDLDIKSGDEILDLLFLTTSFGNYKLTNELFQLLKKSIDLKQACILFNLIHKSRYSLQLAFLFNYLKGYIAKNREKIFKDTELFNSIPISLLELISSK
ncbi:hypothetical protein ACTFIU_010127 [Dictyostelium citrinum]